MSELKSRSDREPKIVSAGNGRVEIAGDLTFETVAELRERGAEVLQCNGDVTLDLNAVTRADSAGLALMVEWLREARNRETGLHVVNMPDQMLAIARMSKLDGVLLAGDRVAKAG